MPKNRDKPQGQHKSTRPIAAVYRGPVSSEGCSESLADLLRRSTLKFEVHYLGPGERDDICERTLGVIDLLAWPGGGGEYQTKFTLHLYDGWGIGREEHDERGFTWRVVETKADIQADDQATDFLQISHYTPYIQKFIRDGGLYAGVCLGAFFARGSGGDYPRPSRPIKTDTTASIESDETFFGLLPPGSYVSSERFENGAEVKGDEDTIIRTDWTFGSGEKKGTTELGRWQ